MSPIIKKSCYIETPAPAITFRLEPVGSWLQGTRTAKSDIDLCVKVSFNSAEILRNTISLIESGRLFSETEKRTREHHYAGIKFVKTSDPFENLKQVFLIRFCEHIVASKKSLIKGIPLQCMKIDANYVFRKYAQLKISHTWSYPVDKMSSSSRRVDQHMLKVFGAEKEGEKTRTGMTIGSKTIDINLVIEDTTNTYGPHPFDYYGPSTMISRDAFLRSFLFEKNYFVKLLVVYVKAIFHTDFRFDFLTEAVLGPSIKSEDGAGGSAAAVAAAATGTGPTIAAASAESDEKEEEIKSPKEPVGIMVEQIETKKRTTTTNNPLREVFSLSPIMICHMVIAFCIEKKLIPPVYSTDASFLRDSQPLVNLENVRHSSFYAELEKLRGGTIGGKTMGNDKKDLTREDEKEEKRTSEREENSRARKRRTTLCRGKDVSRCLLIEFLKDFRDYILPNAFCESSENSSSINIDILRAEPENVRTDIGFKDGLAFCYSKKSHVFLPASSSPLVPTSTSPDCSLPEKTNAQNTTKVEVPKVSKFDFPETCSSKVLRIRDLSLRSGEQLRDLYFSVDQFTKTMKYSTTHTEDGKISETGGAGAEAAEKEKPAARKRGAKIVKLLERKEANPSGEAGDDTGAQTFSTPSTYSSDELGSCEKIKENLLNLMKDGLPSLSGENIYSVQTSHTFSVVGDMRKNSPARHLRRNDRKEAIEILDKLVSNESGLLDAVMEIVENQYIV